MPGYVLWEVSVKKGEKLRICKIMAAGEDVRHHIRCALDVGDLVIVAVVPTVEAGEAAQVCGGTIGGDRSLAVAGDGGGVVIESG